MIEHAYHCYTDAGLLSSNPTSVGFTWAYCFTDIDNEYIAGDFGFYTTSRVTHDSPTLKVFGQEVVGRYYPEESLDGNIAEMIAMIHAAREMPDRWDGTIFVDNICALHRMYGSWDSWSGVPPYVKKEVMELRQRTSPVAMQLLHGHPKNSELIRGSSTRGAVTRPVSVFNVWCDAMCQVLSERYKETYSR